jgi:hypothetical protein
MRRDPRVDYFGSYEIITSTFRTHEFFDQGRRNVTRTGVDAVMDIFSAHFCPGEAEDASAQDFLSILRKAGAQRTDRVDTSAAEDVCDENVIAQYLGADRVKR